MAPCSLHREGQPDLDGEILPPEAPYTQGLLHSPPLESAH